MANGTPWSKQEENFVRRNINKLTIKQMADTLNRPYGGVAWKRSQILQEPKKSPVKVTTNAVPVMEPRRPWYKRFFS